MNLAEILKRLKEIKEELNVDGADINALKEESRTLIEEKNKIEKDAEERTALLNEVTTGIGSTVIRTFDDKKETVNEEIQTRAFLKNLLGEELNEDEKRAFVHTTENTEQVIPKNLQNKIYSYMEEKHPLLQDVQVLRSNAVITVVKHTEIKAGDAKAVAENAANDDEQNTFVNVTLAGKDFSKHVDFSYRLGKMAIPAFESYLIKEIGDRIGSAMAKDIVAQIKTDLNSKNKFTPAAPTKLELADVLKALSVLKKTGKVYVYANNASFYGVIAGMEGAEGRLSFIPNYQESISGQILGKGIKEEDALADGEILFLDPDQFIYNIVQDIMIERDRDIKKHVHTISGFAIAGGTMLNDRAGALITATVEGA